MDDRVLRGMAKWPNVPAVYGWLALDRRGNWRIKGERVSNPLVAAFIGRNYDHDTEGRWFFQNGPQRVYVALDYTPLVYRIVNASGSPLAFECHTGAGVATVNGAWLDENGTFLLECERGIGLVDDRDLERLFPYLIDHDGKPLPEAELEERMDALAAQREASLALVFQHRILNIEAVRSRDVPRRFHFIADPQRPPEQEACD